MINEKINSKIIKLWNKNFKDNPSAYSPLFYNDITRNGIVFVGINPSSSLAGYRTILKDTLHKNIDPIEFFLWKNVSSDQKNIDICLEVEKLAFQKYAYFKIMHKIGKELNAPIEHIDIFLYKERSQEKFKELILSDGKLNYFALDQLTIFEECLVNTKPKVIVVANAYGSEIINGYYKENLIFDKNNGWHNLKLNDGRIVPIFFSSMLSGQRALDIWSRQRLIWHIKQALRKS